jgi:hypothetical protein
VAEYELTVVIERDSDRLAGSVGSRGSVPTVAAWLWFSAARVVATWSRSAESEGDGPTARPPSIRSLPRATYEQTRFGVPDDGLLVQVQLWVALGWVVVTEKLVPVPVVVQVTPPEPV